jgi:hypothetical protein
MVADGVLEIEGGSVVGSRAIPAPRSKSISEESVISVDATIVNGLTSRVRG